MDYECGYFWEPNKPSCKGSNEGIKSYAICSVNQSTSEINTLLNVCDSITEKKGDKVSFGSFYYLRNTDK